jgi:hypothetical protein
MLVVFLDTLNVMGARVCDVNTTTKLITPHAKYTVAHAGGNFALSLARLSATKFIFYTYNNPDPATARVVNVSGTTVSSWGALKTLSGTSSAIATLIPLTATTALWANEGVMTVLSIDGSDNITENTSLAITSDSTFAVGLYSATKAVSFYQDSGDNFYLKAQLVTVSGVSLSTTGGVQTIYTAQDGWNDSLAVAPISATEMVVVHDVESAPATDSLICQVVTLAGGTLSPGATLQLANTEYYRPRTGVATNATTAIFSGNDASPGLPPGTTRVTQITKSGTVLSHTGSDFADISVSERMRPDSLKKITDDFALAVTRGSVDGTILESDVAAGSGINHIWLSTDGAATFTDIGDSATWTTDLVGGVVVVPGTTYQTIYAAVGTNLYKTIDGGTAWTLETAIGYEVDFLDLEKDNTTVFMAKRDAAGTNRASLWDGTTLTHINTGKSTTGGATSGGDVV